VTFVVMAAYEAAELLLLEVPRGTALWLAVLLHCLQVAAILGAAWVVLRALRQKAAHEEVLARMVETVVFAREQERRHVAYELHDAVSPLVVSAKQHAETARDVWTQDGPRAIAELARTIDHLQQAVVETRRLLRALRPSLDADGLGAAVRRSLDEAAQKAGWAVEFQEELGDGRLPAAVETAAFRIVQEALRNALKHAHAERVAVQLRREPGALRLRVRDHGVGFADGGTRSRGIGLVGMQERAQLLGGGCTIVSERGHGTTVDATLPLQAEGSS
jgi:signal transduction histidine kinase